MEPIFREIQAGDIEALFSVRARTRENPLRVTPKSSAKAIASRRVRGWVCTDGTVVGFCTGCSDTGWASPCCPSTRQEASGVAFLHRSSNGSDCVVNTDYGSRPRRTPRFAGTASRCRCLVEPIQRAVCRTLCTNRNGIQRCVTIRIIASIWR